MKRKKYAKLKPKSFVGWRHSRNIAWYQTVPQTLITSKDVSDFETFNPVIRLTSCFCQNDEPNI